VGECNRRARNCLNFRAPAPSRSAPGNIPYETLLSRIVPSCNWKRTEYTRNGLFNMVTTAPLSPRRRPSRVIRVGFWPSRHVRSSPSSVQTANHRTVRKFTCPDERPLHDDPRAWISPRSMLGEFHPRLGNTMNDPKQQAEEFFKEPKPTSTMSDYEREQDKIRANLERLRRERLARDA
jgi:hypothetical protein